MSKYATNKSSTEASLWNHLWTPLLHGCRRLITATRDSIVSVLQRTRVQSPLLFIPRRTRNSSTTRRVRYVRGYQQGKTIREVRITKGGE